MYQSKWFRERKANGDAKLKHEDLGDRVYRIVAIDIHSNID